MERQSGSRRRGGQSRVIGGLSWDIVRSGNIHQIFGMVAPIINLVYRNRTHASAI